MDNLARELDGDGDEVLGVKGTVAGKESGRVLVTTARGRVSARRAASCLLDPGEGDTVLVGRVDGDAWVLAVLDRDTSRSAEISVEGDLRLRAARGKVAIVAQEGIDLISAGTTKIVSNGLELRTNTAHVLVEGLDFVGGWVKAEVDRAKLYAQSLDQVLDRFSQRVKSSYRRVEEMDQLQAGSAHHRIEKTLRVHSHDTALTADGLVKIDGKQIHVG